MIHANHPSTPATIRAHPGINNPENRSSGRLREKYCCGWRDLAHHSDVGRAWSNVKLLVFKLYVNENTATGLYSYIGSVNFFRDETVLLGLREAIDTQALWTRGQNGLGPPTDLYYLVDRYATLTKDFLRDSKRWRK